MNDTIYFASDFHFGIPDPARSMKRESLFIRWLDMAGQDAKEIFLMGDLFDFWFEYRRTVPRGHIRLLGKLAEITDSGIPVHLFRGNHDMWAFSYLSEELNIRLHRDPEIMCFGGKLFYLAHGDGLGPGDKGYKFISRVFSNPFNQWLFGLLHPDAGIPLALFWSRRSRYAAEHRKEDDLLITRRLIETRLVTHSRQVLAAHPEIDYFIYGHYHYPLELFINESCRQIVLGDWLTHFSYAVFDGETLTMKVFA